MQLPSQDPEEAFDPFGAEDSTWNDPHAFYDRPPPPRVAPSNVPAPAAPVSAVEEREEEEVGEILLEENLKEVTIDDSDFTGGSAYMDTTQFLRTNIPTTSGSRPAEHYASPKEVLDRKMSEEEEEEEGGEVTPTEYHSADEKPDDTGPYDFPIALSHFPASQEQAAQREAAEDSHDASRPSQSQPGE